MDGGLWMAEGVSQVVLRRPAAPNQVCEDAVKVRLNESEERELIRRAKAGDDGARNRLWEAFFLFAVAECRRQAELMNLDLDIAEGAAALEKAVVLKGSTGSTTIWPTALVSEPSDSMATSFDASSAGARNSNVPPPAAPAAEIVLPESSRIEPSL